MFEWIIFPVLATMECFGRFGCDRVMFCHSDLCNLLFMMFIYYDNWGPSVAPQGSGETGRLRTAKLW